MNIKVIHTFPTGSEVFFKKMPKYKSHDKDKICVIDYPLFGEQTVEMNKDYVDSFFIYNYGKDKLIDICIKENVPMRAGKFLNPDFAKYLDLTIEDLVKLKPLFYNMDDKHIYEKMIYDYYIQNNGFWLTDEQLEQAYKEYKSKRN